MRRVIALIAFFVFSSFLLVYALDNEELPQDIEQNLQYDQTASEPNPDNLFQNLEVVANLGYSLIVTNHSGEIPILMPIRVSENVVISSPTRTHGVKLKKGDLVDLWVQEVSEGFYTAERIALKERPSTSLDQLVKETKPKPKRKAKKAEDRFFSLIPENPSGILSKVIVDTFHQNAYGYGPDEEIWFVSRCVTGRQGWATPRGQHRVTTKERNRYLDGRQYGEDYHLWVYYWMPFYRGAGLHDAGWRETFWVNPRFYGSHGCVNLPVETAKFIYEHSKVGMRVVVK